MAGIHHGFFGGIRQDFGDARVLAKSNINQASPPSIFKRYAFTPSLTIEAQHPTNEQALFSISNNNVLKLSENAPAPKPFLVFANITYDLPQGMYDTTNIKTEIVQVSPNNIETSLCVVYTLHYTFSLGLATASLFGMGVLNRGEGLRIKSLLIDGSDEAVILNASLLVVGE